MEVATISDQGHQVRKEMEPDWRNYVTEANALGFDVRVRSAGRDNEKQRRLFSAYVKAVAAWERAGRLVAKPKPVAAPGQSEHEDFRAVDVDMSEPGLLEWTLKNSTRFNLYFTAARENWHLAWYPGKPRATLYQRHLDNLKLFS